MNTSEMLTFMVENGLLSVDWHHPQTHQSLAKNPARHKKNVDVRIVAFHQGQISDSELCSHLGIEESELLKYLVDHGVLFL